MKIDDYRESRGPQPGLCFGCGREFQAGVEPYRGIYCNQDCRELVCGPLGERGEIELSDVMKEENKGRPEYIWNYFIQTSGT